MKTCRDDIRVGDVVCKRVILFDTWNKGWTLPCGGFTKNPLTAQYEAEREHNRRQKEAARASVKVTYLRGGR